MQALNMNVEVRAQWCAALRSGAYQQTTGVLHRTQANGDRPAGFCCLGVLCELAVKAGVITKQDDDQGCGYIMYGDSDTMLPEAVQDWAGLAEYDPEVAGNDLTIWNDSRRKTFAEIADLIEGIAE